MTHLITKDYLTYFKAGKDARNWYREAHKDILVSAKILDVHPSYLAGVCAAISPRCTVRKSCEAAVHLILTGEYLSSVPVSVRKHVQKFLVLGQVAGPKTGEFYRNLVGDEYAVCIDSHMLTAAGFPRNGTATTMGACAQAVRDVAKNRSTPASAQACIWVGYLRGQTDKALSAEPFPILEVTEAMVYETRDDTVQDQMHLDYASVC